jgi:UDP-3-O-[3-hydroxymyristoyl] glucosamine N-acyltransferase
VPRQNEYQHTLVRRGATIGANATIVCGATIGRYAFIGAGKRKPWRLIQPRRRPGTPMIKA